MVNYRISKFKKPCNSWRYSGTQFILIHKYKHTFFSTRCQNPLYHIHFFLVVQTNAGELSFFILPLGG